MRHLAKRIGGERVDADASRMVHAVLQEGPCDALALEILMDDGSKLCARRIILGPAQGEEADQLVPREVEHRLVHFSMDLDGRIDAAVALVSAVASRKGLVA